MNPCRREGTNFYPRPPRGGRRFDRFDLNKLEDFYPRPPRGGRPPKTRTGFRNERFLSTPSARRATFFAISSPETHLISIHALREEGDSVLLSSRWPSSTFLSTPSARRATYRAFRDFKRLEISIHALREEGDATVQTSLRFHSISIHALREEGDCTRPEHRAHQGISIHALREEGDLPFFPCLAELLEISIHALREEGDSKNGEKHLRFCFIIKRSAQIWKSFSKNIRKKSRDLHRMP